MIDAHVHLFPDKLFDAIWRWFDKHAWAIHDKLYADALIDRLEAIGCQHVVGLLYAHRTEMGDDLNRWIGALARRRPTVIPSATVHPLDDDVIGVVRRAKEVHGARLVKQHCHVLGMAPDDVRMFPLYESCIELGLPLNLHVGTGPKLRGYAAPTDRVAGAHRVEPVLRRYPELKLIVPHLGAMEESTFIGWLDRHPNLMLDTAMAMVPFLPGERVEDRRVIARHPGRVMFGTDYPSIPYPLQTERDAIEALGLDDTAKRWLIHDAAAKLLGVEPFPDDGG